MSVAGGTVGLLTHAFNADFRGSFKPIDMVTCFSINDVGNGTPISSLWRDLMKLKAEVLAICPWLLTGPSTFAMATVPFPPKYTRFDLDTYEPQLDCISHRS